MASEVRKWAFNVFRQKCVYCHRSLSLWGNTFNNLTLDHLVPRACGGQDHRDNYVAACPRCNRVKGNRELWEFLEYGDTRTEWTEEQAIQQRLLRWSRFLKSMKSRHQKLSQTLQYRSLIAGRVPKEMDNEGNLLLPVQKSPD